VKKHPAPIRFVIALLCSILAIAAAEHPTVSSARRAAPLAVATGDPAAAVAAANAREVGAEPAMRQIAADNSGTGVFELRLNKAPDSIARAFLVYDLTGVPNWTAAVRSINDLPALGGFAAVATTDTASQVEEINPRWLRAGVNKIVFQAAPSAETAPSHIASLLRRPDALPPLQTTSYGVGNLRLVYVEGPPPAQPSLCVSYPSNGEHDSDGTVLRGFVDPSALPGGPAELFVNDAYIPQGISQADGSFAVFVPRPAGAAGDAWEINVEVVYPDGTRLRRSVDVAGDKQKDDDDSEDHAELDVDGATAKGLSLGKARLDVTPGALDRKLKLTMRGVRREQLPALDAGMTNVTPRAGGFRFGPHGLRFKKALRLRLPYDSALLPKGMTVADIRTYFFDDSSGRWRPLSRMSESEQEPDVVVSETTHFTDFINATLAMPEEPQGENFAQSSIGELAKADPASQVVQIAPPQAGPTGDATLDFPIVVPPGRLGMQPQLAVRYDSSGGNGWLGVGWDLRVSSIEISTLFGVPQYQPDGNERYLIDGDQLSATGAGTFVRRVEGGFEKIVRNGSGPTDYWWEVTDKNGTRSIYGKSPQARLRDPNGDRPPNIFRWYLEQQIDLHGNSVDYAYLTDSDTQSGEPWTEVYPQSIDYTGANGSGAYYHVLFRLDAANARTDRLSSGRQGFKTYTRHRLAEIDVVAGTTTVRQYLFNYREGDFHKTLLASLAVTGEGGAAFYSHSFNYVSMPAEPFLAPQAWPGLSSKNDFTSSDRLGGGAHGFVGLGPGDCQPHVGVQLGGSDTETSTSVSFMDVDGDGLPDRVDTHGNVELNAYSPMLGSQSGSFRTQQSSSWLSGLPSLPLGHTSEWSFDFGVGVHAELPDFTAGIDASWAWSHANDDHVILDMDGDQRPDLVSAAGGSSVLHNDGSSFSSASWSGFTGGGLTLNRPDEEGEVLNKFTLSNPVRQLVLPYSGHASVSGAIRKSDTGGDGVEAWIYYDQQLLWHHTFDASDVAPCLPDASNSCNGGLSLDASAGHSLYFIGGSVRDTDHDALLWSPVVSFDGHDAQAREAYGARTFVFDAGDDFRIGGFGGAGWSAAGTGTVQVSGPLVKDETTDDVGLTIVKLHRDTATGVAVPQVIVSQTFAASAKTTFESFPPFDVVKGDIVFLRLASPHAIVDPALVRWTPIISYSVVTDPPDLSKEMRTLPAEVAFALPNVRPRNGIASATQSWIVPPVPPKQPPPPPPLPQLPYTGKQYVAVSCTTLNSDSVLAIQGPNRLYGTLVIPSSGISFVPTHRDTTLDATDLVGQALYVTLIEGDGMSGGCSAALITDYGTTGIPVNEVVTSASAPSVLSGGYHGWFYGEWNGNVPFDASALVVPQDQNAKPNWAAAVPRWEGVKGHSAPAWTAGGFDFFLAGDGMKPSRKGRNVTHDLESASGATGSGLSVLRKSSSRTEALSGNVLAAGVSGSHGKSETEVDLVDMNGDRYPDQVSGSGVRFSNGKDRFGDLVPFPGLGGAVRGSEDVNIGASVSLGIEFTKRDGAGNAKAVLNTMPSVGAAVSFSQSKYDLIDVNGDGLPDRVSMQPGSDVVMVELNLGYRFGKPEIWSLPHLTISGHSDDLVDAVLPALNPYGSLESWDGLSVSRTSTNHVGVAIGPFGASASTSLTRTEVELIDINGDGLPDRVAKDEREQFFRVQLNLGDRWDTEQRWPLPLWDNGVDPGHGYDLGHLFRYTDAINLSGHVDLEGSVGAPICIPLIPPIVIVGLQIEISAQLFGSLADGTQLLFEDIDGDGLPDHILKAGDGTVYVKRNQAGQVNLLSDVIRPLGGAIHIAYERRGNTLDDPNSHWVMSLAAIDAGPRGPTYTTHYHYDNDSRYDRTERESLGFHHLIVTSPEGSTTEETFANTDFYQRYLPLTESLRDASNNLLKVKTSTYALTDVANGSKFPALTTEVTEIHEAGYADAKVTTRAYAYDTHGNITKLTDDADDADGHDDIEADVVWQSDPTTNLNRPMSIDVYGAAALMRSRKGTYDDKGNLIRLEQKIVGGKQPDTGAPYSGTNNAVSTFAYDASGQLTSATDPSGYTASFAYDAATHTHPTEVRDSFGYVTQYAYDLKYGVPATTTDENGNSMSRTYDPFGRLLAVFGPYDTDGAPTLRFEYGSTPDRLTWWSVVHHKDVTRSNPIDSSVFIDALERTIETKEAAEVEGITGPGMRVSGRVGFDAKGRLASQGQPVFDPSAANTFVDVASKNPTNYAYDALDRVRTVSFPNGAVTRLDYGFGMFNGLRRLRTTRTDPANHVTTFYRDVHDNVVGVEQPHSGAAKPLAIRYAYDALDQLNAVTDPRGNTTTLEYDTLGHNVTLINPDLGRTEYRYDVAGNRAAKITANLAAKAQQVRYRYTFDRLDRIEYPQSPATVYTYGAPGAPFNRANRIATLVDESGLEERSYGKLGELVQTVKTAAALNGTTPKGPYTTRMQFDSLDRLLSVTYPDGETLTYGFDAGGKVNSATGTLNGARFDYLRHVGRDEFGDTVRIVLGNGADTRYTHDPASRFLTQLRTTSAGRDLQNLAFQYDLTGTVLAQQNNVAVPAPSLYGGPSAQSFAYDDLVRLTGAQGTYNTGPNITSTYSLALSYDDLGNTLTKNQLHQIITGGGKPNPQAKTTYNSLYAYAGTQPHAPTHIGDRTFHYDADGNQIGWESDTTGTRRTLTWDEENRLLAVADNGQTTRFLYDADGARTNKAGPNGETIYVNQWFSIRNGAIASKHVFIDDHRIATKVSPDPTAPSEKVYFYQPDRLGSAQFVTDQAGLAYEHLEYFPSGETWVDEHSDTQRTPYLFSGQELDDETGLSYFGHRYYDARQGQWISADPALDDLLDTDKLTDDELDASVFYAPGAMYGYVADSPVNFTDPNGYKKTRKLSQVYTEGTTEWADAHQLPKGTDGIGGSYGTSRKYSKRNQVESNHFPAKSSYKGTPYDGIKQSEMPAVTMVYAAHRAARTTGFHRKTANKKSSVKWREEQKGLLDDGKFDEAMAMDINDMLNVTNSQHHTGLVNGIKAAIDYAGNFNWQGALLLTDKEVGHLHAYTDEVARNPTAQHCYRTFKASRPQ